jgi:hypothetical protein
MARSSTPQPPRRMTPEAWREAIAQAESEGVARADMVLHLTLRDASELKRDRNVAVEDIAFAAGVMRYVGVRVEAGGVTVSALNRPGA